MPNVIDFLSLPLKKLFSTGEFKAAVKRFAPKTPNVMILKGDWNATTNTISTETETGSAYRVTVQGSTNLGGITDWKVGDLAVKTATGWTKIDNTDAMTSFNNRTGAVTLSYGDVTNALTFTPANTSNSVTINGDTQYLGNNPNFTISSGGGASTFDIQVAGTSNYISQGEVLSINQNGEAQSIVENYLNSPVVTVGQAITNNQSASNVYNMKSIVCPTDPTKVVTIFTAGSTLYAKYGRVVNGALTYDSMASVMTVASSVSTNIDVDWNPFNESEILVSFVDNSNTYKGYFLPLSADRFSGMGVSIDLAYSAGNMFYGCKYHRSIPKRLAIVYIDSFGSGNLVAESFEYVIMNGTGYKSNAQTPTILDTVQPYTGSSTYIGFDTLADTNIFGVAYTYATANSYESKVVTFYINNNSILSSSPYSLVDSNIYQFASVASFGFINANTFVVLYMNNNQIFYARGQYELNQVYTIEPINSIVGSDTGISAATLHFPTVNRNVFGILYKKPSDAWGGAALKMVYAFAGLYGITTTAITTLSENNAYPDYISISEHYLAGAFLDYKDGVSTFFNPVISNDTLYDKITKATHIYIKFTKETLIGIANTSGGPYNIISVTPFGGVATVQMLGTMSAPGRTYYIQENGSITTAKSDVKLGIGLDYSNKLLTISYPV